MGCGASKAETVKEKNEAPTRTAPDAATPTVASLTALGLPEVQATASVKAIASKPAVTGIPTHCYCMMKIKEGADVAAMTAGLEAYSAASKSAPGKVAASYTISDGAVYFFEVYDSPAGMDAHIGFCFPEYIKIVPHADMTEIVCVCDPSEVDWWTKSASAWGASKFVCAAAKGTAAPGTMPTVESLTALGLPEEQAANSVKAIASKPAVTGIPTHCHCMLKVKEGADIAAMTAGLEAYAAAAKAAPGKVAATYTISEGEVHFFEIYDSPGAMDAHIGFCFPEYIKVVPHADMTEITCMADPSEVEWWTKSASALGASKFVCAAAK